MKCGRIWGCYSWQHLVHDSQMGWLELVSSLSFFFRLGREKLRWWRSCICDKLLQGVYTPWGNRRDAEQRTKERQEEKGEEEEGERRGREREGRGREPCRNKLAVSCRGTEGETKMDTLMLPKSRRWVEATAHPGPFHSTAANRYTSLSVLFI